MRFVISVESISPASLQKAMLTQKCWRRGTQGRLFGGGTLPLHLVRDMAIATNKTALHLAFSQIHVPYWTPKPRMGEPNSAGLDSYRNGAKTMEP